MSNRGHGRASATRTERRRAAVARRRRNAKKAVAVANRGGWGRRRLAIVGGGVAAVVVIVIAILATRGGDDGPDITDALTGTVLSEEGSVLAIEAAPSNYRVTYASEGVAGDEVVRRTIDVLIRRPFDGLLTATQQTDEGEPTERLISQLGLYAYATDTTDDVLDGMPTAARGDLRLDAVLDDLVGAGLFVPRERREVLGRECQVYRTGSYLETLAITAPTDEDHADVCIDAAGLVLEQLAVQDGEHTAYEIATNVDTEAVSEDADFEITGDAMAIDEGGSELVEIASDAAPVAGYWEPAAMPEGYEHVGRYALRVAAPEDGATSTTVGVGTATVETYVDVYRNGPDFVIVQQGDLAQDPGTDTTLGIDASGSAIGAGRVAFGLAGNTYVATTDTWFVEITASMPAADVASLAVTFMAS